LQAGLAKEHLGGVLTVARSKANPEERSIFYPRPVSGVSYQVLLIHDASAVGETFAESLRAKGYAVKCASSLADLERVLGFWDPDMVLLDLALREGEWVPICHRLRQATSAPIVLLWSPGHEARAIRGLDADLVVRPMGITLDAFAVRMSALVDRPASGQGSVRDEVLDIGPLSIHPSRRKIDVRGHDVHFPRREYDLLLALALRPGVLRTRDELFLQLWGHRPSEPKTLDIHIRRLRAKIELTVRHPRHIVTVRGIGYYFDPAGE
jgi:two-component system response regulator RegX3